VAWAREAYRIPERRACRVIGVSRSTVRYRSVRPPYNPLRNRLRELAAVRVSAGYRPLHTYLRREGWRVNHKLVERLYREEGLTLKQKKPRRRKSAVKRKVPDMPKRPNERWAMDFMHDTLAEGRTLRVLTVVDVYSRECVALVAGRGFKGEDVGVILSEAGKERGALPEIISVDNGTEFTSKALDHWAGAVGSVGESGPLTNDEKERARSGTTETGPPKKSAFYPEGRRRGRKKDPPALEAGGLICEAGSDVLSHRINQQYHSRGGA
jgi:putative transposase